MNPVLPEDYLRRNKNLFKKQSRLIFSKPEHSKNIPLQALANKVIHSFDMYMQMVFIIDALNK